MTTDLHQLNRLVARRNLEMLQGYHVAIADHSRADGDSNRIGNCKIALSLLKNWRDKNIESLNKAKAAQVFGGKKPVSWDVAFLPFLESMAVYLRDYGNILAAHHKYSEWRDPTIDTTDQHLEDAITLYVEAAKQINELVEPLGMQFIQICDLPHKTPKDEPKWSGPYCGAFFTTDAQSGNPFIGLAFKGTSPFNQMEILTDLNYDLIPAGVDFLQDQSVSHGVFAGLFTEFTENGKSFKPYTHILESLGAVAQKMHSQQGKNVRAHVTGHSLGGSYSSLCSAQLLIDAAKFPEAMKMGDQYTFGAPRVGSNDWAVMNRELIEKADGQTWRIVNNGDIVPEVPPTDLKDAKGFYHTDQGIRIFSDKAPELISTEINGPLPPGRDFKSIKGLIKAVMDTKPHFPNSYYNSILEAIQSANVGNGHVKENGSTVKHEAKTGP